MGDLSWGDEVDDPGVKHLDKLIKEGQKFSRDMFIGGLKGYAVPTDIVANAARKRKRRRDTKPSSKGKSHAETSNRNTERGKRKRSKVGGRDQPQTTPSDVAKLVKACVQDAEAVLYAKMMLEMKELEAKILSSLKTIVPTYVSECLEARKLVDDVLAEVSNDGGEERGGKKVTEESNANSDGSSKSVSTEGDSEGEETGETSPHPDPLEAEDSWSDGNGGTSLSKTADQIRVDEIDNAPQPENIPAAR